MFPEMMPWLRILLAVAVAFLISFLMTPPVKRFAEAVGAVDLPSKRRINDHPVPRMGGIAIVCGFMVALLLFADITKPVSGILIGSMLIAIMGGIDDVINLNPWIKLGVQIVAALVAIRCGVVLDGIFNPFIKAEYVGGNTFFISNWLGVILTLGWIVMCTNAVNLIDGLDGLAVGVSAISSVTMLLVSLMVSDINITIILACLCGACIGFMPYNLNPAKIFMGDVGAQTLGFILATASTLGLFKMHAVITFLVPMLALAVPLADTVFAFFRRILHGQSPFVADKGHFHHRLLALGLNQKQAVAILYGITAILGFLSVLLAGASPLLKIGCLAASFMVALVVWIFIIRKNPLPSSDPSSKSASDAPAQNDEDIKIYTKGEKQ